MWLVPEWLDHPTGPWRMPARIICLDVLLYQKTPDGPADLVLSFGIPKSVLDGEASLTPTSVVIERPEVRFAAIRG
jgi:hypothetical protein